ncbi:MAG: DUF503 domain-containing protein [Hydrogenothermaceae bacterium]
MVIGSLILEIYLPQAHSLKEKRMIIKSLKEKLRNKFNVSVSEVNNQDSWQSAVVAVVTVASDKKHLDRTLQSVINFLDENFPHLHINISQEIL